jgi:5'-nucleotidase
MPHKIQSTKRTPTSPSRLFAYLPDETTASGVESPAAINGNGVNGKSPTEAIVDGSVKGHSRHRYGPLLEKMNLSLESLDNLPSRRPVSSNDVFCNRELRLDNLRAIGFDMDYTLAQYKQPQFDKLAFDGAKAKLVHSLGYPEEVLDFEYDHTFWVRGLIIDTKRGNFLKIDRHKYVRVAYHGFQQISSNMRKQLYSRTFNKVPSFTEKSFVNMDTLFQHVDAHLFASLIELKDFGEHDVLDGKTYEEIYRQVRECVDLCHRDGVIKDEVARDPERYLVLDDGLLPMLRGFRDAGVKVFLLTNSYWEYTSTAMNYLYHEKKVDQETQKKNDWMELFDLVVVGSCKPAYLTDPYLNLFRVMPEDGSLRNTDGLFEIEALGEDGASKFLQMGKTFQGGNWNHLQAMLDVEAGEEILYVGDHLYADVLRSKRALGWRSCFIMPELPEEMRIFHNQMGLWKSIMELRKLRDELTLCADGLRKEQQLAGPSDTSSIGMRLRQFEEDEWKLKNKLTEAHKEYHSAFHSRWGQMVSTQN